MYRTRQFRNSVLLLAAFVALAASAWADDHQKAAKDKERELLQVLRTSAPAEKAVACKRLAVYGSDEAVPELAKLLTDEHLASWARIALEAIPGPAADEALRGAMDKLQGKLLVGTINSIGVRRDASAVEPLSGRLKDSDIEVAAASAVALGHIGNAEATKTLRQALAGAAPQLRTAIAEGCVLCAERHLADGQSAEAAAIYDQVRGADVPKQKILEATRGAILARKSDGIPLLMEQLRSSDKGLFQLGLSTARELPGREVADALAAELAQATPERAALLLEVLADRKDKVALPAVLAAVKSGPVPVRIAAIGVLPRLGDASCVPTLLEIAVGADAELTEAAKTALAGLPGADVDAEITSRLPKAEGKTLPVLIELVGQRRIDATAALFEALDHSDAEVRRAALTALGDTVDASELSKLISEVVAPKHPEDAKVAKQALRAACIRMPDREACAEQLLTAMSLAPASTKYTLLETLGAMSGPKALETVGAAAKSSDPRLQDLASRLLGQWMDVEAAPVLLDLAKTAPSEKYRGRALRGYIRLVRQFPIPDDERVVMCRKAIEASTSPAEKKLVLQFLGRYPTIDMLKLAAESTDVPELKEDASKASLVITQKLIGRGMATREELVKMGLDPVKFEVTSADGAGARKQ